MQIRPQTVTPEAALNLIEANTRNRPKRPAVVAKYANLMAKGEWRFNGDTIRIDRNGVLLDGQHRLHAIVESGVAQDMIVVSGLEPDVFTTIDVGAKRSAGDALALLGTANYNEMAAAAKMYLMWKTTAEPYLANPTKNPSHEDIVTCVQSHPHFSRAAPNAPLNAKWLKRHLRAGNVVFMYTAFSEVSEAKAAEFMDLLASGEPPATPLIRRLRDTLMEDLGAKRKVSLREKSALTFKVWRYWMTGKEIKQLRIRSAGERQEKDLFRLL